MNLYPFLAYVFVTTFTPGPNNVMSMANAMRFGYRRTLRFLAGFLAVTLAMGLASTGLGVLVAALARMDRQADSIGILLGFVLGAFVCLRSCFSWLPSGGLNTSK